MKIPIIIVNWNGYTDTCECIESVLKSREVDYIIYVIDNGSADNEGSRLVTHYKEQANITFRLLDKNIGFAKANNLVIKELIAEGYPYIALLNNDTVVDPFWLSAMIKTAKEMKADLVSVKLLNYFGREQIDNLGHQMLNTGEIIPIAHGDKADDYQQPFYNMGSCAGATLYSVRMLKHIGMFDPHFSTGYEDAELGVRAIVAGYRSAFAPSSIVFHKMGQSVKKIFNQKYALMIQSAIWYTYFKLMPIGVIIISLPFIILKNIALTFINIFFGRGNYLKIQWQSIFLTVFNNRSKIWRNRKAFFNSIEPISSFRILAMQRFFLFYDISRFYRIFLQKRKSALDQYGGE